MPKAFVITNPMIAANKSAEVTLSKFLRVINPEYSEVAVLGGNVSVEADVSNVKLISRKAVRADSKFKRILDHLLLQLWMAAKVLSHIRRGEVVFYWIGDKMILPYLACKLKKCVIHYFIYGNVAKEGRGGQFTRYSSKLIACMANHADYVCLESPSVLEEWKNVITASKSKVIHLYTEFGEFVPYESRDKTVGMVCRLTPGKHIIESIKAFCSFHERYPEWRLEIIGSGKQEAECKQLIADRSADSFINMRGWVEHDEVLKIAKKWGLFLFPTDTEGMPNSVLEMMGIGVPALASAVGGIKDVIVPDVNGWFLSGVSVFDIEKDLCRAVEDPHIPMIAENARQHIFEHFSLRAAQLDFMSTTR